MNNSNLAPVNQFVEDHQISTTVAPLLLILTTIIVMAVIAGLWQGLKVITESLVYWIFGNAPSFSAALEIIHIYHRIPKRKMSRNYWVAHRRYLEQTLK